MQLRGSRPKTAETGMTLVEVVMALFIAGLTLMGIVRGYQYCLNSSVQEALSMAANAQAQQRLEQTCAAPWVVYGSSPVDQLTASNYPDEVVVLDRYALGTNQLNATLDMERAMQARAGSTSDFDEGVKAFFEKREAAFAGA